MPAGGVMSPVVGFGSGKFGTPWARMQRDTARSFCISWGLTGGGDVVGGSQYFAQVRCAAWNFGDEATEPTARATWPLKALMALGSSREAGSGKFTRPCERMHLAYSRSAPPGDALVAVVAPAGAAVVVVVPIRATPASGEPAHAATASAKTMKAGATSRSPRRRGRPIELLYK